MVILLGKDALKRLKVLQSLDDLGLGFNLAIRDLEIRGAGNLLGREQHGNVIAVGFELYTKILKEAVLHLKGEELALEEDVDPEVKLGVTAFIPDYYVPDISERLVLYQRLASVRSDREAYELAEEIEDRFGAIGPESLRFIELMRFRGMLRRYGVVKAEFSQGKISLSFSPRAPIDASKIVSLVQQNPQEFRFSKNLSLTLMHAEEEIESADEIYQPVQQVLENIRKES